MQFKRLRLSGFKSFVEPAELRIEPGLTGVVGPNGCGKSNLLEAIRWVMGESSAKAMRGGGMDDVIFAGTTRRPARDFAEVTLSAQVDTPGAYGTELEVVRRIERGAGSVYRVNGRDVRARDVSLVFADAATGAHSPALVSQGRIAAVIAAKPTERRMMLEEAAGIAGAGVDSHAASAEFAGGSRGDVAANVIPSAGRVGDRREALLHLIDVVVSVHIDGAKPNQRDARTVDDVEPCPSRGDRARRNRRRRRQLEKRDVEALLRIGILHLRRHDDGFAEFGMAEVVAADENVIEGWIGAVAGGQRHGW